MNLWERFKAWRIRVEWNRKYPDPFIVCPDAFACPHVDGMLCVPRDCEWRIEAEKRRQGK